MLAANHSYHTGEMIDLEGYLKAVRNRDDKRFCRMNGLLEIYGEILEECCDSRLKTKLRVKVRRNANRSLLA